MKLIAPAIVLSSLYAVKVWASALKAPALTAPALTAPALTAPALTAPALTAPALTAPIEGYGVMIPEWEVEVFPGGPMIKLNGTIQEVHRELLRQNPDWDTHYSTNITRPSLNKRALDVAGYFCGGRWKYCDGVQISDGIDYLRRVKGLPNMGPGPGNCGRVSCSWDSAIWWCNDARESKTLLGGFGDIADGADFLLKRCAVGRRFPNVAGQVFTTTDWNVIVRFDSNHC